MDYIGLATSNLPFLQGYSIKFIGLIVILMMLEHIDEYGSHLQKQYFCTNFCPLRNKILNFEHLLSTAMYEGY